MGLGWWRPPKSGWQLSFNEYGDLSLPEYLFPWFFGPINNPHAASRKKNLGHITKSIDEQSKTFSLSNLVSVFIYTNILFSATGALLWLAGNNPVQNEGKTNGNRLQWHRCPTVHHTSLSVCLSSTTGQIVTGQTNVQVVAVTSAVPTTSSTPTLLPKPSSSSSSGPNVAAVISTSFPLQSPSRLLVFLPYRYICTYTLFQPYNYQHRCRLRLPKPFLHRALTLTISRLAAPKKRQLGLNYHRHHRRLSHVPRHDHDFFHNNYWIPCYFKSFFFHLLFLLHLSFGPLRQDILWLIFRLSSPVVPYFLSGFLVLGIEFVEFMCIYLISHFLPAVRNTSRRLRPIVRYVPWSR